eukprot:69312-Rhodomonas_salina.1
MSRRMRRVAGSAARTTGQRVASAWADTASHVTSYAVPRATNAKLSRNSSPAEISFRSVKVASLVRAYGLARSVPDIA